jgi:plastocyanin
MTHHRRTLLRRGGSALAVAVAGCSGGGDDDTPAGSLVEATDELLFDPVTLTVEVGATVTWENVGSVAHTVTAYESRIPPDAEYFASGGFDSEQAAREKMTDGLLRDGDTYQHTFEVAGTYDYVCIPHEGSGMKGSIEVK